jgi:hypothetical protein
MPAASLFAALDAVPDFRSPLGRRHHLQHVLALAVVAILCGGRSLYAIAQFGRDHEDDLASWLGWGHGPPSVATLHRVFSRLDAARFEAVLARWLGACAAELPAAPGRRDAVAIDGKALRGSQGHLLPGVHLLAAFGHRLGLPLAQARVPATTNEAKAALPLLRSLVLTGRVVTGDAMFCQREVCEAVVAGGGHYVLAVKENQPELLGHIAALLPDAPPSRSSGRSRSTPAGAGSSGGG